MNPYLSLGLAASLGLTLLGCEVAGNNTNDDAVHKDTVSAAIDASNALDIAAAVYRVIAVDVPFTVALAMDPSTPDTINSAACTSTSGSLNGGNNSNGNTMSTGMDMFFYGCVLSGIPPSSSHTLTVNGSCTNTAGSSIGIEIVKGEKISFTTGSSTSKTLAIHNFSVTRNNDNMTNASGMLHLDDGNTVSFNTPTAFAGTASTPTAGILVIGGISNSMLRLSVTSTSNTDTPGTNFTLEVDTGDGNGYGTPTAYNWSNDFWLPLSVM